MSNHNPPSNPFLPGNKVALGNDKTLRFSTWLSKALNDVTKVEGYEAEVTKQQVLSEKLINKALKANDPLVFQKLFAEIADRVDGKPKQSTEITGKDGGPIEFANYSDEDLKKIINGIE